MVKLLIADRDENERVGIKWLVSSYSIPYVSILLAGNIKETISLLEKEMPDVVCLELDMVRSESWNDLQYALNKYAQHVVVMTAEATFDRAMQAIQLHAYSFWLKPILPDEIRRVLQYCYKNVRDGAKELSYLSPNQSLLSYRSLFVEGEVEGNTPYGILLLQPEDPNELQTLRHFIEEYSFQFQPAIFPLSDMVACVFDVSFENKPYLKQLGNLLLKQWEEQNLDPIAGVFYLPERSQTLHQSYLQAKQALQIHFFKGYRQITIMEEEIRWREIDPFLTPEEQRDWIEMLNSGDLHELKSWMHREFLSYTYPYPEPALLRTRITSILAQVRRFMKSYLLDQGELEIHYHRVFDSILYTSVLYRIVQDVLLFLKEVLDRAAVHREEKIVDVTEKAIQYMEQHFTDSDLTLEKVAKYVDRSPSYLSSLLSVKKGETFRQLLTQIRIKEAQQLLLDSTKSIQEIASETGYSNANYFSRMFKETVGVSPRTFRDHK
ncbi:response regulator transcription factor [Bacillus carboniphilus]|uniref:Response regulator transcription factor n=1 Tax=Bacillus carboniphilus TaxID=86663 RepID=A0ABN0VT22_9BACI